MRGRGDGRAGLAGPQARSRCSAAGSRTGTSRSRSTTAPTCSGSAARTRSCSGSTGASSTRRRSQRRPSASGRRWSPSSSRRAISSPGSSAAPWSGRRCSARPRRSAGSRSPSARCTRAADRGALRLVPRRRGLRRDGCDPRHRDPARVRARARDGGARRAGARAGARAAVPQRPAHRQLHRRRPPDPDRRLGVRGHGRRLLRPGELRGQQRALRRRDQRVPARPTSATSAPSTSAR